MKLVAIGLDGASFELLDPWIEEGSLPNIRKIKDSGVYGDMESCLPPVTSPNWKCYSTGKNPGKLGIFWWENIDVKNKRVYYPTQRKFEHKQIWDYLSQAGYRVGVIGTPLTYPPKKVNGFMISGGLDAEGKNYTFPKDLEKRIEKEYDFKVRPTIPISIDEERGYEETNDVINKHFKVGKTLWDEYDLDFLQLSIFDINVLHHFFWNDERTKRSWKLIDGYIGDFMDKDVNVMLMSDHGSNKIEHVFNINTWLEKESYLKTNTGSIRFLHRVGITTENLSKWARKLGIYGLKKLMPKTILSKIPGQSGEIMFEAKTDKIDWGKSRVIASGQGPLYINKNIVLEGDYGKLRQELIGKISDVRTPDMKKPIKHIYKKEEIYKGKYLSEAPDLILDQEKGVHIPGGIGKRGVFDFTEKWVGENKKHGLFALYGNGIKEGAIIENFRILDLAPTILHMFSLPIPRDMDGGVLKEIFREGSESARREVKYQLETNVEKERLKERIRGLKSSRKI